MKFAECHDYYLGQPLVVDYVVCEDCGLIQQTPVPQDVLPLYEEYPVHEARSGLLDRIGRLLMQQVYHDTLADPVGSSILDYGCGSGAYLASLKGKAFDLCGFELDAAQAMSVSARLGVPVYSDGDALMRERGGHIDILTMHFVLEHVTDLDLTIASVSQLLRPGGVCHIVVPNPSSWEGRLFGKKWHGLDPPRHISFPALSVIDSLA